MRRYVVLLGLFAICRWGPALAQESEARESCTWERAGTASVEQITANFREWQGKCVRVKALHAYGDYATRNRLLSDRMAVLEDGEPRQRSMVLNGSFETEHAPHRPRWEEVLGTVGSCEIAYENLAAMQAADPDSIIMLAGLCHYTTDHFLVPVAYRALEGSPAVRLRRAELHLEQVKLQEATPAHPFYPLRRETGERMFAALEEQDFEAFLALEDPDLARDRDESGEDSLGEGRQERVAEYRKGFDAAVAAFRASRIDRRGSRVMLFEPWLDDEDGAEMEVLQGADFNNDAYWCRLRDGAGEAELAVHTDDIDNHSSRPYFCVWTGDYVIFREGTVPSASVPLFEYGFLEQSD